MNTIKTSILLSICIHFQPLILHRDKIFCMHLENYSENYKWFVDDVFVGSFCDAMTCTSYDNVLMFPKMFGTYDSTQIFFHDIILIVFVFNKES
jgi:hypothetical protein